MEDWFLSNISKPEIPVFEIDGVEIPCIVLGNLPFLGESYQGLEKNKLYSERFCDVEATTQLLVSAFGEHGLTAVSAMPPGVSRLSDLFFQAFRKASAITGVEPRLVACFMIPLRIGSKPVDDYRRWVTYHSIEAAQDKGVHDKYLSDPIILCREGWNEKFPKALAEMQPYGPAEIRELTYSQAALEKCLRPFEDYNVLAMELGSETDFLAMTGRMDLLQEIIGQARDHVDGPAILGIHHAGTTIPIIEEAKIDVDGYVTPVNSLGALMLPNREKALLEISRSSRPIIAIKPMAGGRISPEKAFRHVYNEAGARGCMIGVASEDELETDTREALRALRASID